MAVDWRHEAVEQFDYYWRASLWPRLQGMTDEEYLWEPVAACWSIRPRAEAKTPMADGKGDWVIDFAYPEPDPPPFTTIAWRLFHIAVGCFGQWTESQFGGPPMWWDQVEFPPTAAGGLTLLDETYARWSAGVRSLDDEGWARPVGPAGEEWAASPMAALVLHINREAIHHGAEIALLRDLYRDRERS